MNIHRGGGGGGVWNAHLLKNHWERGSRFLKNHWARGLSNIEKHGGGGGGATWQFFVVLLYFRNLNSGTYQNCLLHVAILDRTYQNCAIPVRTRIVRVYYSGTRFLPELLLQFWDVPELSVNYFPIAVSFKYFQLCR